MASNAAHYLGLLGVDIRTNSRANIISETSNGKTEITLASGDKLEVDLYIPTVGVIPNSSFLSGTLLDKNGFIRVDDTLSVIGAQNLFAIGEVSNHEAINFLSLEAQSKHMANNVIMILSGKRLQNHKKSRIGKSRQICLQHFRLRLGRNPAFVSLEYHFVSKFTIFCCRGSLTKSD